MSRVPTADNVGVTFVNLVLGRGTFNNVVNLTLGVCQFSPHQDPKDGVDMDIVVASRLRMDVECARDIHNSLGELLKAYDDAKAAPPLPAATNEGVASGKPN